MEFLIKINNGFRDIALEHFPSKIDSGKSTLLLDNDKYIKVYENKNSKLIWIGDFILNNKGQTINDFLRKLTEKFNVNEVVRVGGFFYCIFIDLNKSRIRIINSFLSILPLYYYESDNSLIVSSSSLMIGKFLKRTDISKKFILEKLLFNYPFRNSNILEGIKSIPSNSYIKFDGKLSVIKHTDIADWFEMNPIPWRKALSSLSEYFINRVKNYFPNELFYLSFTGGFDGRTLLSILLNSNKNYKTYSFGTMDSEDITIPLKQSEELGIKFSPFYLDDRDYTEKSLNYGLGLVKISDGMANFARAHYAFAVDKISEESNYIITGNFGSELFRAMHNTGVVVSEFLFKLLSLGGIEKYIMKLDQLPILSFIRKDNFKFAIEELKSDLISDDLFNEKLSLNKRFYKYIFEEIFRKYFGAEIKMQFDKLINRSPFIDPYFIREVFKTQLAGVYSNFYESNPVKRFKGQSFYAEVIARSSVELLNMKTGKGYSPKTLRSFLGKGVLFGNYIKKKIKKKKGGLDPFGVENCFAFNRKKIDGFQVKKDFFTDFLFEDLVGMDLNDKINYYSLNWLIEKIAN